MNIVRIFAEYMMNSLDFFIAMDFTIALLPTVNAAMILLHIIDINRVNLAVSNNLIISNTIVAPHAPLSIEQTSPITSAQILLTRSLFRTSFAAKMYVSLLPLASTRSSKYFSSQDTTATAIASVNTDTINKNIIINPATTIPLDDDATSLAKDTSIHMQNVIADIFNAQ